MKAPYAVVRKIPQKPLPSPVDFSSTVEAHLGLLRAIEEKRQALQDLHDAGQKAHAMFIQEAQQGLMYLDSLLAQAKVIQKGDKGDTPIPGVHFPIPINGTNGRDGKDGQDGMTPVIDHEAIAKKAAKLIKLPEFPKPEKIDPKAITQAVIKTLQEDKPLTMEHVRGLSEEIASYRNQLAGKHYGSTTMVRGGGDVVTAGSNIAITTNADGQKVITGTGGGVGTVYTETPTGLINGSNKIYTTAHAITTIFNFSINGQYIHPADYSVVGSTITFVTALDASLSGLAFTIIYA